jgi:CysZ protein
VRKLLVVAAAGDNLGVFVGFFRGLWAPFRGAAFVAKHGLWHYLLLPILVNAALITGAVLLGVHVGRRILPTGNAAISLTATIGLWVVAAVLGLVFFVVAQPLVSAPFVDALTEKVESVVRGGHPRVGFWRSAWKALLHGLLKLICYLTALILVWALTVLTGIGGGIGALLSALLLAYDGFDYPLARRGAGFGGKWRYLLLHPGQTLGYCVGASLLYLIPPAIVVAPAFAAVGATLAFLDTDIAPGASAAVAPAADEGATT